jgi:hypothetical protein
MLTVAPQFRIREHHGRHSMKDTGRAFILAAGLTAVTMSLHCETPQAGTSQVSFQSSSYSDFRQLLAREVAAGTVTVRANLGFPEEAKDRYPAPPSSSIRLPAIAQTMKAILLPNCEKQDSPH